MTSGCSERLLLFFGFKVPTAISVFRSRSSTLWLFLWFRWDSFIQPPGSITSPQTTTLAWVSTQEAAAFCLERGKKIVSVVFALMNSEGLLWTVHTAKVCQFISSRSAARKTSLLQYSPHVETLHLLFITSWHYFFFCRPGWSAISQETLPVCVCVCTPIPLCKHAHLSSQPKFS